MEAGGHQCGGASSNTHQSYCHLVCADLAPLLFWAPACKGERCLHNGNTSYTATSSNFANGLLRQPVSFSPWLIVLVRCC